jgi:hypothetical protein
MASTMFDTSSSRRVLDAGQRAVFSDEVSSKPGAG